MIVDRPRYYWFVYEARREKLVRELNSYKEVSMLGMIHGEGKSIKEMLPGINRVTVKQSN